MDVNEWSVSELFNIGVEIIRKNQILNLTSRIVLTLLQLWISTWTVLWVSVFAYVIFYNMYIPSVSIVKEVDIQYDSTCHIKVTSNSCKIPTARVALTEGRTPQFMRGQTYQFTIYMDLPESDVNWSQGMFMMRLTLLDQNHNTVLNVAKPTGLKYKSSALRGVFLLLYWPLYIMGFADETQHISVDLITDFIEGSHPRVGPTIEALLEFEARDIQIYPPTILKITAALTGLRYYMYHWRVTSFVMTTTTLCFFLYILTLIGFTKWNRSLQTNDQNRDNDDNEDMAQGLLEEVNQEIDDSEDFEINYQNAEEIEKELNEELEENLCDDRSIDLNESGLTGDLSANESEASSTVVIPENEEPDESQAAPDSSSAEM